jgi:rod shape-determining protein MreD
VVALGLFADVLLSRPIGLGALALLLVVEGFRRRALLFNGAPFVLEWGAAVAGFALMLLGMHLALELVFVEPPGLGPSGRHLLATAIAYPLVVLGLVWCLRVRAPRAISAYRLGRVP